MGRENELYRDKIEVSLDGRQIFSLFFAGAVIVCAVFVIGVIVGKRVEARAHVDRATGVAGDPLAALDRLEADAPLSFRRTLRSGQAAGGSVDAEIAAMASAQQVAQGDDGKHEGKAEKAEGKAAVKADARADAKAEEKPDAKAEKPDAKTEKPDAKTEKADARTEKADKSDRSDRSDRSDAAKAMPLDDERAESGKSDKGKSGGEAKSDKDGAKESKDAAGKDAAKESGKDEKKKSRYTLQLSAFQERGEAETFLSELRAAGYSPYVTPAEVDGKAYYRVRLGTYPSYDDAVKAKVEFERKIGRIAYVTKL